MAEMVLQEVETFVLCHQNTVTQFIVTRPIMDLCMAVEGRTWTRVSKWWWEQYGVDVEGMWTVVWGRKIHSGSRRRMG